MDVIFKTPGANLLGSDKDTFDEIKNIVDQATNDFLIRPDWTLNLRCVDLVKALTSSVILGEVSLLLRKKIRSSTPIVVILTIRLMETLVTNCGPTWHRVMNEPKITGDIANAARKFSSKMGAENRSVSEAILDVVQGWGEAFLPRQREYNHIVNLYFTLRKEGLPFKVNNQFDPNRVPIFVQGSKKGGDDSFLDRDTDGILAASLQSSLEIQRQAERFNAGSSRSNSSNNNHVSSTQRSTSRSNSEPIRSGSKNSRKGKELIESLSASVTLLVDLILATTSVHELKSNDIAGEIVEQLKSLQPAVGSSIEENMDNAEILESLFQWNDKLQTVLTTYTDIREGKLPLVNGQKLLRANAASNTKAEETKPSTAAPRASQHETNDLLDFGKDTEVRSRQNSRAETVKTSEIPAKSTPSKPQQQQQQQQPASSDFADFANFGGFPSQPQQQQQVNTGYPPLQLSPPSQQVSSQSARKTREDKKLILVDDPFSDAALDVLLSTPPKREKASSRSGSPQFPVDMFAGQLPPPMMTSAIPLNQQQPQPMPAYSGYPPPYGIAASMPMQGYPPQYPQPGMPPAGYPPQYAYQPYAYPPQYSMQPMAYPPAAQPYPPVQQNAPPAPTPAAPTHFPSNNNANSNPFDIFE